MSPTKKDIAMTDTPLTTTDAPIAGELVTQFCTLDDIKLLRNKYQGLVIIDGDKDSYAQVKAALSDVKAERVGIEKDRKALKQKALDYGRAVDAHAKDLTAAIKPLEDALAREKGRADDAKAAAKAAAEAAEVARAARIRDQITRIKEAPLAVMGRPASEIEQAIDALRATAIDDSYGEFAEHAERERTHAVNCLVRLFDQAVEADKIAADNERLRLEKEQADRDREAAERARKAELANAAARETLYKIQRGDAAYGGFMGPIFKEWMQDGTVESYTSDEAMLHDLQAAGYKAEQQQAERDRDAADAARHPRQQLVVVTEPDPEAEIETVTEAEAIADYELAADRDADVSDLEPVREQLLHLEIPLTLRTDAARGALTFILETRHQAIALIDQLTPLKETQSHVK